MKKRVFDIKDCGPFNRFAANGRIIHNSGGGGINPQNLPRGGVLRQAIRAPEGYCIVACDSSQIEARTIAWFSGQVDLVAEFAAGADVYSSFASKVYGKPINKHDHPNERHVGKTCILGLGYGTGAAKLRHSLATGLVKIDIPEAECKRIVSLYRKTYYAIPQLWRQCQIAIEAMYNGYDAVVGGVHCRLECSGADRTILLPNGMRLRFPDMQCHLGDKGLEYDYKKGRFRPRLYGGSMTENIIQSLARIIVSYQMCRIAEALKRLSAKRADGKIRRVVHMVHDEVIVVVPEEEATLVRQLMERIMSQPPSWAPGLPVACEAGVGKTYVEAK